MKKTLKYNYTLKIALSFICIIMLGTLLLCLPVSSESGEWTSFTDSLFTATSSTCVTGLITLNTATHWTLFGKIVILCMIQLGGLGFMSVAAIFIMFLKRRISASNRKTLMQSAGTLELSDPKKMLKRIVCGTLLFEGFGAVLLSFRFIAKFGILKGIWFSVFHSVSAFCNAGFDLLGYDTPFVSLVEYQNDYYVLSILAVLITVGGIGYIVWGDISRYGFKFRKYSLHSKLCLCISAALLFSGAVLTFAAEYNGALKDLNLFGKIYHSFFQSVTLRTAGFNAIDQNALSESTRIFSSAFMLIGGCPGSTAGGLKTTTFLVVLLNAVAATRKNNDVCVFKRRIDSDTVQQACAIVSIYVLMVIVSTSLICALDNIPLSAALYETSSAIGTVGITVGITSSLSTASHLILTLMMFTGRIGGLSLVSILERHRTDADLKRPTAKILIG